MSCTERSVGSAPFFWERSMPPRVAWKRSPTSSAATNWASIRNGAGCTLRWSQVVVQPPRASSAIATVHPLQIVADGEIEMLAHDTPLDLLATPTDLIETSTPFAVPTGVDWSQIQPDQLRDIPFLEGLRTSLLQ
jgi:hypothetical protein